MKIALLCGTHLDEFQQKVLAPILEDPAIETAAALSPSRSANSFAVIAINRPPSN